MSDDAEKYATNAGGPWQAPAVRGLLAVGVLATAVTAVLSRGGHDTVFVAAAATSFLMYVLVLVYLRRLTDEQAARGRAERRLAELASRTTDAVLEIDRAGVISRATPAIVRQLGWRPEQVETMALLDLVHPEDRPHVADVIVELTEQPGSTQQLELRARSSGGSWVWLSATCANLLEDADFSALVWHLHDLTERKTLERALEDHALYDSLTGLPNRTLFLDRLDHACARVARERTVAAVLFVDLDRFSYVNDTLGLDAGNELLAQAAERLRRSVRPGDTVARLGGDEFAILCENLDDRADASEVASRLRETVARPFRIAGQHVHVGCSVGLTYAADSAVDSARLLQEADVALFHAKTGGRNRTAIFDEHLRAQVTDRMRLEMGLRRTLSGEVGGGSLELHYQPLVRLSDERICSLEALVRWQHPSDGLLMPDRFIGIAEDTGLVVEMGATVRRLAVAQLADWNVGRNGNKLSVSVNLSAHELNRPGLTEDIEALLEAACVDPHRLTVEVTETALMEDLDDPARTLRKLSALGVRIALDDFGTGYSSLTYLRELPVDVVKLDRQFASQLGEGGNTDEIVAALVQLAHALGLEVVLEGIETPEQLEHAKKLGVDVVQGFLFFKPMPPLDLEGVLSSDRDLH